ncbi:ATP-binding cassette domain-containing protein [Candidatus Dependentiae bacterium]|nr:ATP-binding cassette domain-containing protein [Candidatus Dependentiae bacterium]
MLQVLNLSQTAGSKAILHGISCTFSLGKVTALLGPNGAGKTTLLKTIMGLSINPRATQEAGTENTILWQEQIINAMAAHERVAAGIAYLPQMSALFQELTVYKNLRLVFECHPYWQKQRQEVFTQELEHWLSLTNLDKTKNQSSGSLSGGQKRKLEIVRSILMHPRMMICDEPFAGVDPKSIYELKKIFSMLAAEGMGVVISDHHVDQLLSIANYVYVILQGAVVANGTPQDILNNKQTREHYLGYQFHQEMSTKFSE